MPVFLQASVRMHAGWFLSLVMLLYAAFSSLSNPYPKTSASEVPKPSSPQVPDPGHSGVFAEWHFLPHSKRDPVRANVAVFAVWCVWPLPSTCRGAARKKSVTAFSQSLLRLSLVTSLALYVGLSADSLDSRSYEASQRADRPTAPCCWGTARLGGDSMVACGSLEKLWPVSRENRPCACRTSACDAEAGGKQAEDRFFWWGACKIHFSCLGSRGRWYLPTGCTWLRLWAGDSVAVSFRWASSVDGLRYRRVGRRLWLVQARPFLAAQPGSAGAKFVGAGRVVVRNFVERHPGVRRERCSSGVLLVGSG